VRWDLALRKAFPALDPLIKPFDSEIEGRWESERGSGRFGSGPHADEFVFYLQDTTIEVGQSVITAGSIPSAEAIKKAKQYNKTAVTKAPITVMIQSCIRYVMSAHPS